MSSAAASTASPLMPAQIPWLGIVAVLFGAIATTLTSRLTSQGLADIRGALGAGFDEGSWITTAFGAAQMVIGPATVRLGRNFGPRNVLLIGCTLYGVSELLIPFAPNLQCVLVLQVLAGLGSGTFIPVTPAFILLNLPPRMRPYGVAAYVMNIVLALNVAATLEGWYTEHASWQWIFWQNAIVSVPLFLCFWFGLPHGKLNEAFHRQTNYRAAVYLSIGFGLIYVALDQGDRLDWFESGLIVGLFAAGLVFLGFFLLSMAAMKTPTLNFALFSQRNFVLILIMIGLIRFLISSSNIIVPNFLSTVHGLKSIQVGSALLWVALPQLIIAPVTAWVLVRTEARLVMVGGIVIVAIACLMGTQLSSDWNEQSFTTLLLIQAVGQTLALTALVYFFALHFTVEDALSFGVFANIARLMGGEIGSAALTVYTRKTEQAASNLLGLHVGVSDTAALDRLQQYAGAVGSYSDGTLASQQSAALLAGAVKTQAYTLAYQDGFWLAALVAGLGIVLVLLFRPPPPQPLP
jgi:DHA2 family multidrug resistance protein